MPAKQDLGASIRVLFEISNKHPRSYYMGAPVMFLLHSIFISSAVKNILNVTLHVRMDAYLPGEHVLTVEKKHLLP